MVKAFMKSTIQGFLNLKGGGGGFGENGEPPISQISLTKILFPQKCLPPLPLESSLTNLSVPAIISYIHYFNLIF